MIRVLRSDTYPYKIEVVHGLPEVNTARMRELYLSGACRQVIEEFEHVFDTFARFPSILAIDGKDKADLDEIVTTVLDILSAENFVVDHDQIRSLFSPAAGVFANLVAMSSHGNTDRRIRAVLQQGRPDIRALFLWTLKNTEYPPMREIFEIEPVFVASLWWLNHYPVGTLCYADAVAYGNFHRLLEYVPTGLSLTDVRTLPIYALASYLEPGLDREVKQTMNRSAQDVIERRGYKFDNRPEKGKIAVVASRWNGVSAIYKTSAPHIHALRERGYHLTLIHLNEAGIRGVQGEVAESEFHAIREVNIDGTGFDYSEIAENNFELVYFPDIGMNDPSVWLANMQIAPIQVMGLGHPVSTYGARIDYIVSGAEVELSERYAENYTERLVLIPGLGAAPVNPHYRRRYPKKNEESFVINCPWILPKLNFPILQALRRIQDGVRGDVVFNFFPSWTWGGAPLQTAYQYLKDLQAALEHVVVTPEMPYHDYLKVVERGHMALLSYPYGGCNTVVDALIAGLPVVCIEGTKWYNRSGPGLLRRIGLQELVVQDLDAYVAKTVQLANDSGYLAEIGTRIVQADLEESFFNRDEPRYFADAIDFLISNHDNLKNNTDRTPIVIRG